MLNEKFTSKLKGLYYTVLYCTVLLTATANSFLTNKADCCSEKRG